MRLPCLQGRRFCVKNPCDRLFARGATRAAKEERLSRLTAKKNKPGMFRIALKELGRERKRSKPYTPYSIVLHLF